jgi:hypothetical protein
MREIDKRRIFDHLSVRPTSRLVLEMMMGAPDMEHENMMLQITTSSFLAHYRPPRNAASPP